MNKKSKKYKSKKRTKTRTKKGGNNPTCDNFCENDYSNQIENQLRQIAKKNNTPYNPSKEDKDYRIAACKQNFCNEGCKNYTFFSDSEEEQFKKNINGSFLKKISPKWIKKLQSKGALSYCDKTDYNPFRK